MCVPELDHTQRLQFPDPRRARGQGVVAIGGNLSPGILLSAYEQGIFPWYSEPPIVWYSLDPRFVLYPAEFHLSRRNARFLRTAGWRVAFDENFPGVIRHCATAPRRDDGTWITPEMEAAYCVLHQLGFAHDVAVYDGEELIGGLYGVQIGAVFAGESMFSRVSGASKAALVALMEHVGVLGIELIDCQMRTPYLEQFGARFIARREYLLELQRRNARAAPRDWRALVGAHS